MKNKWDFVFILTVILVAILGFWDIYFSRLSEANFSQHLHAITSFFWLLLILLQRYFIQSKQRTLHKNIGLSIFFIAPAIFASVVLLVIHSAHKTAVKSLPDDFLVRNATSAIVFGLIVFLAFLLRKNRNLHGTLIMSSTLFFLGIGLIFAGFGFISMFNPAKPDFGETIGILILAVVVILLIVSILMYIKDKPNGWPWLFTTGLFVLLTIIVSPMLEGTNFLLSATLYIGSIDYTAGFIVAYLLMSALMAYAWKVGKKP